MNSTYYIVFDNGTQIVTKLWSVVAKYMFGYDHVRVFEEINS